MKDIDDDLNEEEKLLVLKSSFLIKMKNMKMYLHDNLEETLRKSAQEIKESFREKIDPIEYEIKRLESEVFLLKHKIKTKPKPSEESSTPSELPQSDQPPIASDP